MARFLRRCIDVLEDIYRFDDARRTVSQFELSGPIQPVHDVSREAELGSSPGVKGFFHCGVTLTHAGAGTENEAFSLYDPTPGGGAASKWEVDWTRDWVWIMDAWTSVAETNASNWGRSAWYVFNQDLVGVGPGSTSAIQPQMIHNAQFDPTALGSSLRAAGTWGGGGGADDRHPNHPKPDVSKAGVSFGPRGEQRRIC